MKRILVYVLTAIMTIMPLCCGADEGGGIYLALGDSITTGFGLEDSAFGFADKVSSEAGLELAVRAGIGASADDIYKQVASGELDENISSAQLITITCGGNDMLDILYGEVALAYNTTAQIPVSADDVAMILADESDNRRTMMALRALAILAGNSENPSLADSEAYMSAVENFGEKLSAAADCIRKLNSDTKVIFVTQYNPYKSFADSGLSLVYTSVEACLSRLNEKIKSVASEYDFEIADVYTAFRDDSRNLCNSDAKTMNLDFHPNVYGHGVIAECISSVLADKTNIYTDVSESDWYFDAVSYVGNKGLFGGVNDKEFAPDMPITRAMLVTVLHRAAGAPDADSSLCADVHPDSYYGSAVKWAKANGIINGYSEEIFAPDDVITREQLATIMLRYSRYEGEGPVGAWAIRLTYSDLADVADYAGEAVMYCTMKGYMSGRTDGTFAPKDMTTRAETAAILQRYMSKDK